VNGGIGVLMSRGSRGSPGREEVEGLMARVVRNMVIALHRVQEVSPLGTQARTEWLR